MSPNSQSLSAPLPPTPHALFACIYRPSFDETTGVSGDMLALAADFSPRYQRHRDELITIDIRGLDRLLGDPRRIGEEIRRSSLQRGLRLHVGIAATHTAAMVLALARPGLTVVPRGGEAAAVAPLAIGILEKIPDQTPSTPRSSRHLKSSRSVNAEHPPGAQRSPRSSDPESSATSVIATVKSWGLRTLGDLAALPSRDLSARLGQHGLMWQAIARGQDAGPLVPTTADERFESSIELEWPIEGLEPLSFVLTRLLEPLSTRLERRDRGAAAIHVTLGLITQHDINHREHRLHREAIPNTRSEAHQEPQPFIENSVISVGSVVDVGSDTYIRSLQLPSPLRDVRALRTLILLDLESHPPSAPIERVAVAIDPTPGRVLQHALFVRAHPTPEQLSTLLARLHALMGEDRVGRPALVDSYRPGAFAMQPFATDHDNHHREHRAHREGRSAPDRKDRRHHSAHDPNHSERDGGVSSVVSVASVVHVVSALRRCRRPVPARVTVADGRPISVTTDRRGFAGGCVLACAGPWRTSGEWWMAGRPGESGRPGEPWDRDEWDVSLSDGAVYRIFQARDAGGWFIDSVVD